MAEPHNRIALVTGAGSGIGKATALRLLEDGWRVVFTGRRLESLRDAIAEAGDPFGDIDKRALAVPADMTRPDSVAALFDFVRARFGRLDLLFNNAGTGAPPVLLEDLTVEQWRSVVDTNLTGVFLCIQQAFRIMKSQSPMGGRIINNGSISAYAPRPNSAPYTATKHAVSGLTRSASLDGRKYDIAVGQIDIGNAATDMTQRMAQGVPQADGSTKVEDRMEVRHVADSVLHMANLPLSANVLFMNVMATKMPFVGRG
jgi:NAD(P)-dependent dehydrogenase (short-subunit alcohol dehydrogenase family)